KSRPRHGLTLSVGMQIPVWMRSTTYSSDTAEENIISDIDSDAGMTGEKIVESEGVHKGDSHE
ncbi:MAG: hypothetical protein IJ268_01450, partial [Proteobacteria bacterium]|nr:hypothetical protein [Pseudomonadota bacterium]